MCKTESFCYTAETVKKKYINLKNDRNWNLISGNSIDVYYKWPNMQKAKPETLPGSGNSYLLVMYVNCLPYMTNHHSAQ